MLCRVCISMLELGNEGEKRLLVHSPTPILWIPAYAGMRREARESSWGSGGAIPR